MVPKLSQYLAEGKTTAEWAVDFVLYLTKAFVPIMETLQGQPADAHRRQCDELTAHLAELGANPEALVTLSTDQLNAVETLEQIHKQLESRTVQLEHDEAVRQERLGAMAQRLRAASTNTSQVAVGVDEDGAIQSVGKLAPNPVLLAATGTAAPTAAEVRTALENIGVSRSFPGGLTPADFEAPAPAADSTDTRIADLARAIAPKFYARTDFRSMQVAQGEVVPQAQIVPMMEAAAKMPITAGDGKLYVAAASRLHAHPQSLMVQGGDPRDATLQAANDAVVHRLMEFRKDRAAAVRANTDARASYESFLKAVIDTMGGDLDRVAASIDFGGADETDRFAAAAALCGPGNQEFIWRACTSSGTPVHDNVFTSIPVAPGNQSLPLSRYRTMSIRDVLAALNYGLVDGNNLPIAGQSMTLGNKDCPDGTASAKSIIPLPRYCGDRVESTMCAYWLGVEWGLFTEFTAPGMIAAQLQLLEMLEARWYEQQALDYIWHNTTHVAATALWTGGASVLSAYLRELEARFNSMRLERGQTVDIVTDAWFPVALFLASKMTPAYALPSEFKFDSVGDVVSFLSGLPGVASTTFATDPFDTTISTGAPSNGWAYPGSVNATQSGGVKDFPTSSFLSVVPSGGFGRVEAFSVDLGFSNGQGIFDIHTAMGNKRAAFKERAYGFYNLPPTDCFTPFTLVFSGFDAFARGNHPAASSLSLSALVD